MSPELKIKTRTTGFASPAESYVDKRLDLNELVIPNVKTSFYFKYEGDDTNKVKNGNIIVVDKSETYTKGDLIVAIDVDKFRILEYKGNENVWGKVTWILNKI